MQVLHAAQAAAAEAAGHALSCGSAGPLHTMVSVHLQLAGWPEPAVLSFVELAAPQPRVRGRPRYQTALAAQGAGTRPGTGWQ